MKEKISDAEQYIDYKVNIKIKLATLWTTLMFLYIYADYFELMTEGAIEKIMNLESPLIPVAVTPWSLIYSTVLLAIPSVMIFLSVFLKALINKWLNILVALLYGVISVLIIISGIGNKWQAFLLSIISLK